MTVNRFIAAAALALGAGSPSFAAGPVAPQGDVPSSAMTATPVHETCHENVRNHGGTYPDHYHRQSDCRVIVIEEAADGGGYDDCHYDVLRHYLPDYGGKVWHRHSGSSCRVVIYEEESGPAPGVGGCIQVGPVTVCP